MLDVNFSEFFGRLAGELTSILYATKVKKIPQIVTINAFPTTIILSLSTSGKSQVSKNHT